jgi:AcrR family transcriptional regulator
MTTGPSNTARLSVEDWLQAGYTILAADGLEALKLDRLCTALGVTKGSFYWHFKDMATYRSALLTAWADLHDRERSSFGGSRDVPARERLAAMMTALLGERQWNLERAMREWARTDAAVADSVRAADAKVREAVRAAFEDAGFLGEDAEVRANATFAAGIGFLHLSDGPPDRGSARQREQFLDLMLRR